MRRFLILLLIALLFVVLILTAMVLYDRLGGNFEAGLATTTPEETPEEGEPEPPPMAPDFTVTDRAGNEVHLSDFLGKPVILNFWASWCGPCKSEMPDFEEAFLEYGDEIVFMMVNLTDGYQETVDTATAYIDGQGYTFPIYFDTQYSGATTYGVNAVPVTFFVGADGSAVAYAQGALSRSVLQQGIDKLLSAT